MGRGDTKCWYCGKREMFPAEDLGKGWRKCNSCGATSFPKSTKLGTPTLTKERNYATGGMSYKPVVSKRVKVKK